MSDLRPRGVEIEIGEEKHTLLFTINAIYEIQESCNMPLFDAISHIANAADGKKDNETLTVYRKVLTALLHSEEPTADTTEEKTGRMVHLGNYRSIAWTILNAYGVSMPETDEDQDDDEEKENPNAETGQ